MAENEGKHQYRRTPPYGIKQRYCPVVLWVSSLALFYSLRAIDRRLTV